MDRDAAPAAAGVMRRGLLVAIIALGLSVLLGLRPASGQETVAAQEQSESALLEAGGNAEKPTEQGSPAGAAADKGSASSRPTHRVPQHLSPQQVLDGRVRALSRALKLDAAQHAQLREILVEQQLEIRKLRESGVASHRDLSGALAAVLEGTRDRIRAILTDDQRAGYQVPVPSDMTAPAQADLEHWLKLIQSPPQNARAAN